MEGLIPSYHGVDFDFETWTDFETSSVDEEDDSDYVDESFSNSDEDEDEAQGMD